jgi:starch phosphorylase
MKLALNGALTIGTLDGANVEIREHVGAENIFIFGLKADEVEARRRRGLDAGDAIAASPELQAALDSIANGMFSPDDRGRFRHIADQIRHVDPYMTAADFASYRAAQAEVEALWTRPEAWGRAAALNIARIGWFSSDRTIAEYAADIWNVPVAYR